ncbi:hypothetical protein BDN71DRAFT_1513932 [Pleurotus eryngii]|uniref:Uncharacterized protein n=1 Tax=Pleurotus eryngii TaxID=5323 RepID=A0A9P6D1I1_PLEER|nr:hypothetical protein BDN71DRAFT_1513932 [Pleurotus eryngii]
MIASRAPFEDTNSGIWHRACAELLAFPRRYENYVSSGLSISKARVVQIAKVANEYTDQSAAHELARQGVTVDEVHDAQPYGFFWLLDNRFHTEMGQRIRELVGVINKIPKHIVDAVPRFEPQVYLDPLKVLVSDHNPTEASSSCRSTLQVSDDEEDDYY